MRRWCMRMVRFPGREGSKSSEEPQACARGFFATSLGSLRLHKMTASLDLAVNGKARALARGQWGYLSALGVIGALCLAQLTLAQGKPAKKPLQAEPPSYTLHGRVLKVYDGDTFTLQAGARRQRIRMASIDAPEMAQAERGRKGQAHARAASTALRTMLAERTLTLACFETDSFGRHVCDAPLAKPQDGARTANQRMVALGLAWANRQQARFLRDPSLIALEAHARKEKRGLWKERKPVAPWVWREQCWRRKQCG